MCFLFGATQISEIGRWEWLFMLFFVLLLLPVWLVIPVIGKNFFSNVFIMTRGLKTANYLQYLFSC